MSQGLARLPNGTKETTLWMMLGAFCVCKFTHKQEKTRESEEMDASFSGSLGAKINTAAAKL
jgi:hypothetical protein